MLINRPRRKAGTADDPDREAGVRPGRDDAEESDDGAGYTSTFDPGDDPALSALELTDDELAEAASPAPAAAAAQPGLAAGDSLAPDEEIALVAAARDGDNGARERLIRANLRSIAWMARRYRGMSSEAEDLISEGVLGILRAVERFDATRGVRFSTYARWWVREAMGDYMIKQSRTVRLPANVVKEISAISREMRAVESDGGGQTPDRRSVISTVARRLNRSAQHVEQMLALENSPVPLDAVPEPETAARDGEGMPSEYEWTPESLAVLRELLGRVYELMDALSERERIVLVARYGLETGAPETLESIAARLQLTAERVRQVQQEALVKLHARFAERGLLPR